MQPLQREGNDDTDHAIGTLCVGADWACSNGDLETLSNIALQLAAYAPEPLHCKLMMLADLCRSTPDSAVAVWLELKEQMRGRDAERRESPH
ncbi:MAG TPA: hypothetical protein VLT45_31550 [Kofleriaceae bacterium]|nr:hypothetical protein [Kofleriaceae bacterium]